MGITETKKMFGKDVIEEAEKRQPAVQTPSTAPVSAAVSGQRIQERIAELGGAEGLGATTDLVYRSNE